MKSQQNSWDQLYFSHHTDAQGNAEHMANLIVNTWSDIEKVLRSIIGKAGFDGLYRRSIEDAAAKYEWLRDAAGAIGETVELEFLKNTLLSENILDFSAASDTMLYGFLLLLSELIGESLTRRLLQPILSP